MKGSSATLGLIHVRDGCEKIQHFGNGLEENGSGKLADDVALKNIEKTLKEVEVEYAKVEKFLRRFYGEEVQDESEPQPEPQPEPKEEKPAVVSEKAPAKPLENGSDKGPEKEKVKAEEKSTEPAKNHVTDQKSKVDEESKK